MAKLCTSKWTKYKILRRSEKLKASLPETAWLNESSFWRMIDKYGQVIIKPTGSYGGKGVIRIKKIEPESFQVHDGPQKKIFDDKSKLYTHIKKKIKRNYLVQERIPLATAGGRPFDLRVMVQRRTKSPWQVTGKLAKVAGKGFIVTNVRMSSGKVVTVDHALNHSELKSMSKSALLSQMDKVALASSKQLSPSYPWVHTMGIDMGLDKKGKVWIIEVNFAPMLGLFLKLKDKSMYSKIKSFRKK
ncbi:YheC/YheD family protein [Paenibacillus sedimenti]|uniref:YheC/YheD family protein n=1 Tax=Paenibacillus sedimenti TaxID=2770274 RepID=A0A926QJU8_9BACL|nr:YheC/YheD family protein [Paenibacillus sedimenti]MBD0380802.1 YheC/YheD family protein [Paenibacillus sedimenti]